MFHYSKHIRKRIRQRELAREMIEQTVANPERTYPSYRERRLVQRRFHGKLLEVVYAKVGERIILITAYWVEEEK